MRRIPKNGKNSGNRDSAEGLRRPRRERRPIKEMRWKGGQTGEELR